jgi:hypothetical protein
MPAPIQHVTTYPLRVNSETTERIYHSQIQALPGFATETSFEIGWMTGYVHARMNV